MGYSRCFGIVESTKHTTTTTTTTMKATGSRCLPACLLHRLLFHCCVSWLGLPCCTPHKQCARCTRVSMGCLGEGRANNDDQSTGWDSMAASCYVRRWCVSGGFGVIAFVHNWGKAFRYSLGYAMPSQAKPKPCHCWWSPSSTTSSSFIFFSSHLSRPPPAPLPLCRFSW